MPTIAVIGNLKIQIFADDHNPPHFHAVTPDREALLGIGSLEIVAGALSGREYRQVVEWASKNRERLEHEWKRLNP